MEVFVYLVLGFLVFFILLCLFFLRTGTSQRSEFDEVGQDEIMRDVIGRDLYHDDTDFL